ncbi:hypothetical protein BJ912DRAFT_857539, partial [Pholiota molesta]
GYACFLCSDNEIMDTPDSAACPQCSPTVTLDLSQGQRVLEHVGAHILYDPTVAQSMALCGLCLRPSQQCQYFLKKGKAANANLTINRTLSKGCLVKTKFSYGVAAESTPSSPCSNVPVHCPRCSKDDPAIWKYFLRVHFLEKHPDASIPTYEYLWKLTNFEKAEMKKIWIKRLTLTAKHTKRSKGVQLAISEDHRARIPTRYFVILLFFFPIKVLTVPKLYSSEGEDEPPPDSAKALDEENLFESESESGDGGFAPARIRESTHDIDNGVDTSAGLAKDEQAGVARDSEMHDSEPAATEVGHTVTLDVGGGVADEVDGGLVERRHADSVYAVQNAESEDVRTATDNDLLIDDSVIPSGEEMPPVNQAPMLEVPVDETHAPPPEIMLNVALEGSEGPNAAEETGRTKRKRVPATRTDAASALKACECGFDATLDGQPLVKCKMAKCMTQWYHIQCVNLDQVPRNWLCWTCEEAARGKGGKRPRK